MINIAIADDEALFRRGMRLILEDYPDLRVQFEAENGEVTHVTPIRHRVPVDEYLRPQKRFAHLFGPNGQPEMLARIQADADKNIRRFKLLDDEEVVA